MRTTIGVLIVALVLPVGLARTQSKTGTTVGQFLLIEPSARVAAMGNAGSSMYDDVVSAYYNPAALGFQRGVGVQFTHSVWLADISYNYAAAAVQIGEIGNLFLSVTSLNSGEIDVRTVEQPLGTGERYSVTDLAFGLGYGRQISERFSFGLQVGYMQETIWRSTLSAFSLNVGAIYRLDSEGLHLGASISHFGTRAGFAGSDIRIQYDFDPDRYGDNSALPAQFYVEDYPLPILFRVGLSMPFTVGDQHRIQVAVDAFHPSDNNESVSAGIEYAFLRTVFLRAGYQNLFLEDSEVGLTLGAGVNAGVDGMDLRFDYAWADHGRLKDTQRFTVGVFF